MAASSKTRLPETLALRVQYLREQRDLTQSQLARKAGIPLELIRDIEAGLEMFMSPATRQKLARVLRIRPVDLKIVEKRPSIEEENPAAEDIRRKSGQLLEDIILSPHKAHSCPLCSEPLVIRVFERRDLEDCLLQVVKVHCNVCLFRLASE